jgi:hypothetical protein
VLAFRAVDEIEKSDYETILEPAVEAMLADEGEVRFAYVLGDEFDSYSASTTWEDAKLGFGHVSKWKRTAVVTDREGVRHAVGVFGWMVPGDVKTLPTAEEPDAIAWAAG